MHALVMQMKATEDLDPGERVRDDVPDSSFPSYCTTRRVSIRQATMAVSSASMGSRNAVSKFANDAVRGFGSGRSAPMQVGAASEDAGRATKQWIARKVMASSRAWATASCRATAGAKPKAKDSMVNIGHVGPVGILRRNVLMAKDKMKRISQVGP